MRVCQRLPYLSMCALLTLHLPLQANNDTVFDAFKSNYLKERNAFIAQEKENFANYQVKYWRNLQLFKQQVKQQWGFAEINTKKKAVIYSDDLENKVVIDYENQEITVSNVNRSLSQVEAKAILETTLKEPVTSQVSQHRKPLQPLKIPTLADSLGIKEQEDLAVMIDTVEDISKVAQLEENLKDLERTHNEVQKNLNGGMAIAENSKVDIATSQSERPLSGSYTGIAETNKLTITDKDEVNQEKVNSMILDDLHVEQEQVAAVLLAVKQAPPNNIPSGVRFKLDKSKTHAQALYESLVQQQAERYRLSPSLIFAVMEVESSFNPRAESPIPAFGLMQIVPASAGVDVSRFLYQEDTPPTKNLLFKPKANILYGASYLSLLYSRYFKDIQDKDSQLFCVIAAYNTGMGNVAKIFNDDNSKKLLRGIDKINQLSPETVYQRIISNAHAETREYLKKVLSARQKYVP